MSKFFQGILFASGACLLIGVVTIAIMVAGFFLGVILTILVPVALVFTGLGLVWLICKDFDEDPPKGEYPRDSPKG